MAVLLRITAPSPLPDSSGWRAMSDAIESLAMRTGGAAPSRGELLRAVSTPAIDDEADADDDDDDDEPLLAVRDGMAEREVAKPRGDGGITAATCVGVRLESNSVASVVIESSPTP